MRGLLEACYSPEISMGDEMVDDGKFDNTLESEARQCAAPRAAVNREALAVLMAAIAKEEDSIRKGGGEKAIDSQHAKGRLTARERIKLLLDEGTEIFELGLWAAHGMYSEYGGAPAAGVVTGLGYVCGRLCMIIANDATVKAGAFFPMTAKKVLRAQTIALENRIPTLYLVDSSGVFLPLQEDVFPDADDFGRVFRNNAVMSSLGIPQITAIMGMCVAGGAYLPVMTDTVLMTEGSGPVPGWPVAGASGYWTKNRCRRTGRCGNARGNFWHSGLQRAQRSSLHCATAFSGEQDGREAWRSRRRNPRDV